MTLRLFNSCQNLDSLLGMRMGLLNAIYDLVGRESNNDLIPKKLLTRIPSKYVGC